MTVTLSGAPRSFARATSASHAACGSRVGLAHVLEELVVGGQTVESIGTQQQLIAGLHRQLSNVELKVLLEAGDGAGDDVAHRMPFGFEPVERSVAHLFGHPGMVLRQLFDLAVANQIRATIADVRDDRLVALDERARHRRPHAAELIVLADPPRQLHDRPWSPRSSCGSSCRRRADRRQTARSCRDLRPCP